MNTPSRFKEVDLVRAGRAAEKLGPEWAVEVAPDGTIALVRRPPQPITAPPEPVEERRRIRLS